MPGIRRKRAGRGFLYFSSEGARIVDPAEIARIRSIAVPPAYDDVWICPLPNGHLQATARDARGRKQYRYHRAWREFRDASKYHRTVMFARALPAIRRRVAADLDLPGLPRAKVLAALVRLLDATAMRIGNEEYVRANRSFGLTTMRARHVRVNGSAVRFKFRGKAGIEHSVALDDVRLARVVRRCRDLPGEELFTYVDDDGAVAAVRSDDVNEYVREITGEDFSAKDFRTWRATVACALELAGRAPAASASERKAFEKEALAAVAARLGNTAAICRRAYVHPAVLQTYADEGALTVRRARRIKGLGADEARVVAFLERAAKAARG